MSGRIHSLGNAFFQRRQDSRILLLALGAAVYSVVRGVEAYGLYNAKVWAELLAAGSGAMYVPIEVVELSRHASWLSFGFLLANVAVVTIMIRALRVRKHTTLVTTAD